MSPTTSLPFPRLPCISHTLLLWPSPNARYYLDVLELKPKEMVSILGNLDLEVNFAPPKNQVLVRSTAGVFERA